MGIEFLRSRVFEILDDAVAKYGTREAYIFPDENLRLTYEDVRSRALLTSKALLAAGLKKGDRIGLWFTNQSHWIDLVYGASRIGVILVPINTALRSKEIAALCKKMELNGLFVMTGFKDVDYRPVVQELMDDPGVSSHFDGRKTFIGVDKGRMDGLATWESFLEKAGEISDEELLKRQEEVTLDDIHIIQLTSGTTALPKGAMISHYSAVNTANAYCNKLHYDDTCVACVPLPLFHCFGNVLTVFAVLLRGVRSIYLSAFSRKQMLTLMEQEECTSVMAVPTMCFNLMNDPDVSKYDFSRLRVAGIGGSFTPEDMVRRFSEVFGLESLVIGYGLSEAAALCTLSDYDDPPEVRFRTVGKPLDGVEIVLKDFETGEVSADLEEGEILVRGYCVMKGYYKEPEKTAEAIDREGYFHTGDLGRIRKDGNICIIGRIKDIIIRGGENIAPSEIEEKVLAYDGVLDCQCVSVPSDKYGEEVAAFVIPEENAALEKDKILAYLKGHLASYKVPSYVFFTDSFPMNGAGKVLKQELSKQACARLKEGKA